MLSEIIYIYYIGLNIIKRNLFKACIFEAFFKIASFLESLESYAALSGYKCRKHSVVNRELCEDIAVGGVTPSLSLVKEVLSSSAIPVNVMIRPRGGDFVYSEEEISRMISDIRVLGSLNVSGKRINGYVFGCLTPENEVDMPAMKRLMAEASGKPVTFHRAFDQVANPEKALEDIISLGCTHLLTSGNMEDAFVGRFNIAHLVEQAAGRIFIIAGKGIRPQNLKQIATDSKAPQFHGTSLF